MAKDKTQDQGLQELKIALREKKLKRLYVFHGEETFLLQYYAEQIKKQLVDDLTESFNFHRLTKETFEIRSFADAVESLPMMAESTFVWVDDVDIFKLSESDREKISDVLEDIPDYCTLLFTFQTVVWKPDKRMKKLWNAVAANGAVVEFGKQDHSHLAAWITRHFAAEGKKISSQLCQYLIDITGGLMTTLAGEISKIAAYSEADTIVKEDIDAVTEPVMDAMVFQMTDSLGQGNYGMALAKLQQLMKMQNEPVGILGAIGSHIRRLGTARTFVDNGKGAGDLMRLYGIGEYPAKKLIGAARRFPVDFYKKATELVLETDRGLKTSLDTAERLLELLILRLAQEAQNG